MLASRTVAFSSRAARACPVVSARRSRSSVAVRAMKVGESLKDSSEFYRVMKASDGSIVSLAMFVNEKKQPLVLFFYPKAGTPGCTKEACKFRDEYARFQDAGAVVFGVSSDSPEENKAFAEANRLPFLLLTDPSSIIRKTYVFDPNGKCVLSFNSQLDVEKHVSEALAAINKIKINA